MKYCKRLNRRTPLWKTKYNRSTSAIEDHILVDLEWSITLLQRICYGNKTIIEDEYLLGLRIDKHYYRGQTLIM